MKPNRFQFTLSSLLIAVVITGILAVTYQWLRGADSKKIPNAWNHLMENAISNPVSLSDSDFQRFKGLIEERIGVSIPDYFERSLVSRLNRLDHDGESSLEYDHSNKYSSENSSTMSEIPLNLHGRNLNDSLLSLYNEITKGFKVQGSKGGWHIQRGNMAIPIRGLDADGRVYVANDGTAISAFSIAAAFIKGGANCLSILLLRQYGSSLLCGLARPEWRGTLDIHGARIRI